MQAIDKGIEAYPLRLDFRLGKAAAAELCSSWGDVAGTENEESKFFHME